MRCFKDLNLYIWLINIPATPDIIYDAYGRFSLFRSKINNIFRAISNEEILKHISEIDNKPEGLGKLTAWISSDLEYAEILTHIVLYLSMVKTGNPQKDLLIRTAARQKASQMATAFRNSRSLQTIHAVFKWQERQEKEGEDIYRIERKKQQKIQEQVLPERKDQIKRQNISENPEGQKILIQMGQDPTKLAALQLLKIFHTIHHSPTLTSF